MRGGPAGRRSALAPVTVDLAAVVLFVAIGRASHHHAETAGGFLSTFWPFAVGLLAAWRLDLRLTTMRRGPLAAGGRASAVTVAVGMVLRVLAGQGTALAFVVVALAFLGALMVGGRVALRVAGRRAGAASRS